MTHDKVHQHAIPTSKRNDLKNNAPKFPQELWSGVSNAVLYKHGVAHSLLQGTGLSVAREPIGAGEHSGALSSESGGSVSL